MSSFIDSIFDNMSIDELVCRLPGENALNAIKRRFGGIQGISDMLNSQDGKTISGLKEVKHYINDVVKDADVEEINGVFGEDSFVRLFNLLAEDTKYKLLDKGKNTFPIKVVFNLADKKDLTAMSSILDRILSTNNTENVSAQCLSVLNSISPECFNILAPRVLSDSRPEVSAVILSIGNGVNYRVISDHQKMIALKSFAKLPASNRGLAFVNSIDFKLFQNLKPLERLMALGRYLNHADKKQPFDPMPTRDEMEEALFAGCFQYNDMVEDIMKQYDNMVNKNDGEDSK